MSYFVTFQMKGLLSSWGVVAIGDQRPTQSHPTRSAVLGLIAGSLGFQRDSKELYELEGIKIATCVLKRGDFLRDYHTVQVGAGKKYRDRRVRSEELQEIKPGDVMTMLTFRDYRADADYILILELDSKALAERVLEGLKRPRFIPFLGRKSCATSVPFFPKIWHTGNGKEALVSYIEVLKTIDKKRFDSNDSELYWEEGFDGFHNDERTIKALVRDKLVDRERWQFANRFEFQGEDREVNHALFN